MLKLYGKHLPMIQALRSFSPERMTRIQLIRHVTRLLGAFDSERGHSVLECESNIGYPVIGYKSDDRLSCLITSAQKPAACDCLLSPKTPFSSIAVVANMRSQTCIWHEWRAVDVLPMLNTVHCIARIENL